MTINCDIASDLLPLYLDDSCSADSRAALEEHLRVCACCREKLERMRCAERIATATRNAPIVDYAKKVRGRKLRKAVLVTLCSIAAAFCLALGALVAQDMYNLAHPTVYSVEEGVYNLTTNPLETTSEAVGEYIFFTNYMRIEVELQTDEPFDGTVVLYDAEHNRPILYGDVDETNNCARFNHLTSAARYRVEIQGTQRVVPITVTEGRHVTIWNSLCNVLGLNN